MVRERSRERRRVVYDDEPPPPARRRPSPPPPEFWRRPVSPPSPELERSRVVIEKDRYRSPSPRPRPGRLMRRQSSLDTFDRKPAKRYWERDEEYGPPARRDEPPRVPHYVDIPLPRTKALPPPRVYAEREREHFDEIQVSDPHRYGDEDFHAYPERVREREVVRTRRRTRSRDSRAMSRRRGRSRSSSSSSSSSESGGTTLTTRSEYPKKGKTRIPARLVSKRALIELGYPYVEEGNVVIVQKALGQHNIDDLLKLSDEYKKGELEIVTARSSAGDIIEERIERRTEIYESSPATPAFPPPSAAQVIPGGTGPVIIDANPPHHHHHPVDVVKTTVVRDVSPARYTTTSYDTYDTTTSSYDTYTSTSGPPAIVVDRSREVSGHVPVGPVALAGERRHHHHRHSGAYETDDLRSEIRHLETQLARREGSRSRHRHSHSHSRHRSRSLSRGGGELVRAERLSTGELVLYEEEIEQIQEPSRGGPRIERDKRGRLSISMPRYR
ncbi:uncharacterized protein B0H64DRAFT_406646 [Chaetomium fimeti]|uniref:DUF8035 domain-containing protein n=1 Tax=Chaetomium fimeti TaxID=1854472 RepID=A0AAE0HBA8_9PEZI|nr:hypothetical protein B0H64DRAFT_406646 [Chaetomium fimeti]